MTNRAVQDRACPRAFSLLEVLVVVVVLGILAAVVVPRFTGVQDEARASALQSALGGVRSGLATFRTNALISGTDPYPTIAQLEANGTVIQGDLPVNPYTNLRDVQEVSEAAAHARSVINTGAFGWNFFVDADADPPVAVFYANSDALTTVPDGSGGFLCANEL